MTCINALRGQQGPENRPAWARPCGRRPTGLFRGRDSVCTRHAAAAATTLPDMRVPNAIATTSGFNVDRLFVDR